MGRIGGDSVEVLLGDLAEFRLKFLDFEGKFFRRGTGRQGGDQEDWRDNESQDKASSLHFEK